MMCGRTHVYGGMSSSANAASSLDKGHRGSHRNQIFRLATMWEERLRFQKTDALCVAFLFQFLVRRPSPGIMLGPARRSTGS